MADKPRRQPPFMAAGWVCFASVASGRKLPHRTNVATYSMLCIKGFGGRHIRQGQIKLDDRDVKILTILQREGRIPKATLAERVNLTPTPCWERLKRLEDAGIIESYGAQISLRAFGPLTVVFVQIELQSHQAEDFANFEAAIMANEQIVECWAVGGGIDYMLKVVTRDLEAYQALIEGLLAAQVGVKRYYSYVVTMPVKNAPLPVNALLDEPV